LHNFCNFWKGTFSLKKLFLIVFFIALSLFPHEKSSCGLWNRDKWDYRVLKDPALRAFVYILQSFSSSAWIVHEMDDIDTFPPADEKNCQGVMCILTLP